MRKLLLICLLLLAVSCKQETYFNISTRVQPEGSGIVVVSPFSGSIPDGTSVTFKATPTGNYIFTSWGGSLSGSENPKTVTVTTDMTVVANFELKTYPLSVSTEGEGTVNERVITTRTDYGSCSVVELTAIPSTGWSFDHWEGDLSGADNPARITISEAKSVKAVFTKNKYAYNLKIVGPGVVDEYQVETKSCLNRGQVLRLKAIPDKKKYGVFKGWSGAVNSSDTEITLTLDSDKEIIASFCHEGRIYPLTNLSAPSVLQKRLYHGLDLSGYVSTPHLAMMTDYNRDGYPDLVTSDTDYSQFGRIPLGFYLGTENGEFVADPLNNAKYEGLLHCRKILNVDFNGDNIPDIAFVGHGYDNAAGIGEYPVLMYGNIDGHFTEHRLTDVVGFFHGSSAGDFDNDGDCDLFLLDNTTKATLLVNDGTGNFESHPELVNHSAIDHRDFFTTDFFDINHDGYLDLFVGGRYSLCIFGDGHSFNTDNYVFLPQFYKEGFESFNDYCFYDIDNDGQEEVLILRSSGKAWKGFAIQILRYSDGEFIEASTEFISDKDNGVETGNVAVWMNIEDVEGRPCILIQKSLQSDKLFEISDGYLSYVGGNVYPSDKIIIDKGFTIYSDNGGYAGDMNFGCYDNPFLGKACISFNGFGFTEEYNDCIPNGTDMSELVENGYCLEFAIKNSNPTLSLDFKFSSITNREMWTLQTYCYRYEGSEHNCSDEWELVRIPLSSFIDWTDKNRNYWEMIDIFELQQMSSASFYLDEIRIRKIK